MAQTNARFSIGTTLSSSQFNSILAAEEEKLLACIHCGLCLEACPTYVVTGDENDSPRGRLYLMRAVGERRLSSNSPAFERHIDRCLGCRACEQVCPAGVEYGQLLEASRGELFGAASERGTVYRLLRLVLRHVWLQPARLKFAFRLTRLIRNAGIPRLLLKTKLAGVVSPRLEFALALLQSSAPAPKQNRAPKRGRNSKAQATQIHGDVEKTCAMLFTGCVAEGLFQRVNDATARVLRANGYEVRIPEEQVCCGALHAHAGDLDNARKLARQNIQAFKLDSDAPIVTNVGGCGAMLTNYGHLLANDEWLAKEAAQFSSRVRDVSQQLECGKIKQGAPIGNRAITYDASCHLIYGQRAGEAPLKMLRSVPDLRLIPLTGSDRCCGGAGIYNLVEREMSERVLNEKLDRVDETGAEVLLTGNAGCHMQIGAGALLRGLPLRIYHPIELLDESYRNAGMYDKQSDE